MSKGTARKVHEIVGMRGDAALYRLDPPMSVGRHKYEYVVVSAVQAQGFGGVRPETFIFAATPQGMVREWMELPGSFVGGLDHAEALRGAGYVIAEKMTNGS